MVKWGGWTRFGRFSGTVAGRQTVGSYINNFKKMTKKEKKKKSEIIFLNFKWIFFWKWIARISNFDR